MLRCADNSLYTGITCDISRRLHEHNNNDRLAAKYTKARRPAALAYYEAFEERGEAAQREYQLKQLKKAAKERLIGNQPMSTPPRPPET
ncbi:MAG: GIY-YIG nuclease family protein [Gammaproteobacteria bacterium]|nr:GIY-YIG nuclease family protein [Gammaproteobacteria bacterium]